MAYIVLAIPSQVVFSKDPCHAEYNILCTTPSSNFILLICSTKLVGNESLYRLMLDFNTKTQIKKTFL